jgi:carboxypeptidase Taq
MALTTSEKNYKKLCNHVKPAAILSSALRLIEWDQETNMPALGTELKLQQNKLLHELIHKQMTSKKYVKLLSQFIDIETGAVVEKELRPEEAASIKQMRKDYLHTKKLNASFLKKFTEATTLSLDAWKEARKTNSFKTFYPHLEKIVSLTKKKADLLGYKDHPYDALLDIYEPETTVSLLDPLFSSLKSKIHPLLEKIESRQNSSLQNIFHGKMFPIENQKKLCTDVLFKMGLSPNNHHLSETAHPFCCALYPDDIRLTTHFNETNFLQAFLATIHEGGHGLYEAGLPKKHFGTPLAEAASHGIHESQSRIWETCIGHSRPFWNYYYPKIKELFPDALNNVSFEELYGHVNFVKPTLIRIFSDEVTYNLHIILRYEIEKGFLDGSFHLKDLPELWNSKMQTLFGITPKTDSEGCLQDIHWALGLIGYFPSYSLGNLYGAALFESLTKAFPDWDKKIAEGNFVFIKEFLNQHIHQYGRQYPPKLLVEKTTGTTFSTNPYINYLTNKYLN